MAQNLPTIDLNKLPKAKERWTLLDKLGEGTYGQVHRTKDFRTEEYAAAKIIRVTSDDLTTEFEHELHILKTISRQQENVPNFFGAFVDYDELDVPRIWFVMELCHLGPITRLLKQWNKRKLINQDEHEKIIAYALQSTLKALSYLHRSGIMHRGELNIFDKYRCNSIILDVKGSHILVTDDYTIKLIDFGIAGIFNNERSKRNSSVGTALWMAPEVIACANQLDYSFDERCDIWSLGITAIELADGEAPLNYLHSTKVLFEIPRRPPPTVQNPTEWTEDFLQFLSACLIKDYENRPTAEQLLNDQIFVSFDLSICNTYRNLLQMFHQRYASLNESEESISTDRSTTINEDDVGQKNPWIANITKPGNLVDHENNLAHLTYLDQKTLIDSLERRFKKTLIYTYIADVLIAINPKQFLPIDNFNFQMKYSKVRRDLLPHIFAVATTVYNQMIITRQPQCIILSGESGSGKTHAAQNLISELALLGFGEQRALENRLLTMNILLESFGNAQTSLNHNSSRFGKLLEIFFSEYGTIVYVQLSEFLLEKTRVVLASGNQRNFHIFYSIFDHFSTNQTNPCSSLIDHSAFDLFQEKHSPFAYLGVEQKSNVSSLPLNDLFQIFTELNVNEEERTSILSILTAIIHLGNVVFQAKGETTEPGCLVDTQSMIYLEAVNSLLKIDLELFLESLCQSSLMTRGETVTKMNTIAEAQQTRDAMAKSLYARLFDWIIYALNRYFRQELEYQPKSIVDIQKCHDRDLFHDRFSIRPKAQHEMTKLSANDLCSIAILDLFGFETFDYNSYEQLCINIANEQLQYFFRQHTFAWEMKEYENEGIHNQLNQKTIDFPNNRSILDMCLSKPIGLLALLDEESRFPQSTDQSLIQKWRQNIVSTHFQIPSSSNSLSRKSLKRYQTSSIDPQCVFIIQHYAGQIEYTATDFLEKNRDFVPMEILDLLLQSDDQLVRQLFRSRLRKTGSVIYGDSYKRSSISRKSLQPMATSNRTQGTVSTYFRFSLMELVSSMASTQPTFIRCLVPNRGPSNFKHVTYDHSSYFPQNFQFKGDIFDSTVVLQQIKYSGLLETIEIRRQGYSHRILFEEFASIYSCLIAFNIPADLIGNHKQICQLILNAFHITQYAFGKTKLFLKFDPIEQLNFARKILITKIIRLQSLTRMFLVVKQNPSIRLSVHVDFDREKSIARLQAIVRGFLVRCSIKKMSLAATIIQSYWRLWRTRIEYKHRISRSREEKDHNERFLHQIQFLGEHIYQQLTNLHVEPKIMCPPKSIDANLRHEKRKLVVLDSYYKAIHEEYLERKKEEISKEKSSERPSTAPPISSNSPPPPPPCPPPEFFKTTKVVLPAYKRQRSAPASINSAIDELKQLFASRQKKQDESTNLHRRISMTKNDEKPLSSPKYLHVKNSKHQNNNDDHRSRTRCLSPSPILIKGKCTGLATASTSSLLGDLALKSDDMMILKGKLRKTGYIDGKQTLRRPISQETHQIDFRSILRPSRKSMPLITNP